MIQDRPRCILFLDFDGVTHPDPHEAEELFTLLPLIEDVLRGFEACKIVISSSWREVHPLDELREFFAPDMRPRVIGVTPDHRFLRGTYLRQLECEAWLRKKQVWLPQNQRAGTPWVAIDDCPYMFRPYCGNLLAIQPKKGFTRKDAVRLEAMLRERLP